MVERQNLNISFLGEEGFPELLTDADIELLLSNQKTIIRQLDRVVTGLLRTKHKLAQVQDLKDQATQAERNLADIYDLIDDKIAGGVKRGEDVSSKQTLLKQCEQLIARNDRVKKNIADDLTACRYLEAKEAIDPLKVFGSLIGFPMTAAGLAKLFESGISKPVAYGMAAGGALGIIFSFHREMTKGWKAAAKMVCKNGQEIQNSFMLYYIKETAKEVASSVTVEAASVTLSGSKFPRKVYEVAKRVRQNMKLKK